MTAAAHATNAIEPRIDRRPAMGLSWHRVAAGLEEQDGVVALHHDAPAQLRPQPPAQRLGVEDALRNVGYEEAPHASILADHVALAWRALDGFYEEDERILGHAADPYHRIDTRHSSRQLVVRSGARVIAETSHPLVLYESGFAPRWYVPREDVDDDALALSDEQTFCPYKGIAAYYDIDGVSRAAWSYRAPLDEMAVIGDLVSFEPDKVEVTLDGIRLELEPGLERRLARDRPRPQHRRGGSPARMNDQTVL
jgi:uncharacterized protein (DUF427 family)